MNEHVCPMPVATGGLIDRSWCFEHMAGVLTRTAPIVTETDMLRPELLLFEEGPLVLRYCPFDWVNPGAKVVIIGITPGLHQMFLSCREAQRALADGVTGDGVLRRAGNVGAFAGPMRTNLVTMLDGIGLNEHLAIESTTSLFDQHADLLLSTSAVLYPAFLNGKNYTGSPGPERSPILAGVRRPGVSG